MTINLNKITESTKIWIKDSLGEREGKIEHIYQNLHEIDISDGYEHHSFLPLKSYECRLIASSDNRYFVQLLGKSLRFINFVLTDAEYDESIN